MTALQTLRERGPMPALDVAIVLGIKPVELVYVELVAAEASGDARTFPQWADGKAGPHLWEAM